MRQAFALAVLLASTVAAQEIRLGSQVGAFELLDLAGQPVAFAAPRAGVMVITFISTQCPISNIYDERMESVYRDYSGKGVKFVFVNANRTEPAKEVAEHAKSVGFTFPVYKDEGNRLADRFDAQVTPESFVIDATGTLVYRGQVDDNRNEARVQRRSLREALDAVLAGKPVQHAETKAFGCTIKRVRRTS